MLARIRKMQEENEGGFTLIELLVVIIIIGILAAIAIPVFLRQREKGWDAAVKSDLRNAATAEETYLTDNGTYTTTESALETDGFKPSSGSDYSGNTFAITIVAPSVKDTSTNPSASTSYCITGTSASGKQFQYDSANGGLSTGNCT
jgi:type IV pilus assembly protein PilA